MKIIRLDEVEKSSYLKDLKTGEVFYYGGLFMKIHIDDRHSSEKHKDMIPAVCLNNNSLNFFAKDTLIQKMDSELRVRAASKKVVLDDEGEPSEDSE